MSLRLPPLNMYVVVANSGRRHWQMRLRFVWSVCELTLAEVPYGAHSLTWHVPAPHPASISLNRVSFLEKEGEIKLKHGQDWQCESQTSLFLEKELSPPALVMLIFVFHRALSTCQAQGQINNSQGERQGRTSQSFISLHVCHHRGRDRCPRHLQVYLCRQCSWGTMGAWLLQHQMMVANVWQETPLCANYTWWGDSRQDFCWHTVQAILYF